MKSSRRGARARGGRYRKGQVLGHGATGTVYQCHDQLTGEFVAMKEIKNSAASSKEVLKEIETLQRLTKLSNPNIVRYYGCDRPKEHGGALVIYMELVDGGSLQCLMHQFGCLTEAMLSRYTKQILNGLAYLHSQGVLHCDIKPANMLVSTSGVAKLADFGACQTSEDAGGKFVGTVMYASPEAIRGKNTTASDIWEMGMSIAELAMGHSPWKGVVQCENHMAVRLKVSTGGVVPRLTDTVSEPFREFIMQGCLQRNPSDRWTISYLQAHPFLHDNFVGNTIAPPADGLARSVLDDDTVCSDSFGAQAKSSGRTTVPDLTVDQLFERERNLKGAATTEQGSGALPAASADTDELQSFRTAGEVIRTSGLDEICDIKRVTDVGDDPFTPPSPALEIALLGLNGSQSAHMRSACETSTADDVSGGERSRMSSGGFDGSVACGGMSGIFVAAHYCNDAIAATLFDDVVDRGQSWTTSFSPQQPPPRTVENNSFYRSPSCATAADLYGNVMSPQGAEKKYIEVEGTRDGLITLRLSTLDTPARFGNSATHSPSSTGSEPVAIPMQNGALAGMGELVESVVSVLPADLLDSSNRAGSSARFARMKPVPLQQVCSPVFSPHIARPDESFKFDVYFDQNTRPADFFDRIGVPILANMMIEREPSRTSVNPTPPIPSLLPALTPPSVSLGSFNTQPALRTKKKRISLTCTAVVYSAETTLMVGKTDPQTDFYKEGRGFLPIFMEELYGRCRRDYHIYVSSMSAKREKYGIFDDLHHRLETDPAVVSSWSTLGPTVREHCRTSDKAIRLMELSHLAFTTVMSPKLYVIELKRKAHPTELAPPGSECVEDDFTCALHISLYFGRMWKYWLEGLADSLSRCFASEAYDDDMSENSDAFPRRDSTTSEGLSHSTTEPPAASKFQHPVCYSHMCLCTTRRTTSSRSCSNSMKRSSATMTL